MALDYRTPGQMTQKGHPVGIRGFLAPCPEVTVDKRFFRTELGRFAACRRESIVREVESCLISQQSCKLGPK
jgi:hypothetical protein